MKVKSGLSRTHVAEKVGEKSHPSLPHLTSGAPGVLERDSSGSKASRRDARRRLLGAGRLTCHYGTPAPSLRRAAVRTRGNPTAPGPFETARAHDPSRPGPAFVSLKGRPRFLDPREKSRSTREPFGNRSRPGAPRTGGRASESRPGPSGAGARWARPLLGGGPRGSGRRGRRPFRGRTGTYHRLWTRDARTCDCRRDLSQDAPRARRGNHCYYNDPFAPRNPTRPTDPGPGPRGDAPGARRPQEVRGPAGRDLPLHPLSRSKGR